MEIVWFGQSCFRLRSRSVSVVTDPYSPESGLKLPRLTATILTMSCDDADHGYAQAVKGVPLLVSGPGEYEIEGVFVIGVATHRTAPRNPGPEAAGAKGSAVSGQSGDERGVERPLRNTAYLIEFEDLTVCHLGTLGRVLTQEQAEQLGEIDVLLVPVGGGASGTAASPVLTGSQAAEVVGMLEPKVVVPMHYRVPGLLSPLATASRFLKELGVEKAEKVESLMISKGQLPEQSRVVLLEPRQ